MNRYCPRGHDTHECGRYESGRCRECQRKRNQERQRSLLLPSAPVLEECERYGVERARIAYMHRWGTTRNVALQAHRYLAQHPMVHIGVADKWCVALDTHLCLVYPHVYEEAG